MADAVRNEIDRELPGARGYQPRKKARLLTFAQALQCEYAPATGRTRCRCGGALRGAKRFGDSPVYRHFMELPTSDPHRIAHKTFRQEPLFLELESVRRLAARRSRAGSIEGEAPRPPAPVTTIGE